MIKRNILYWLCIIIFPFYLIIGIPNIMEYFTTSNVLGDIDTNIILAVLHLFCAVFLCYLITRWHRCASNIVSTVCFALCFIVLMMILISETFYPLFLLPSSVEQDLSLLYMLNFLYLFLIFFSNKARLQKQEEEDFED